MPVCRTALVRTTLCSLQENRFLHALAVATQSVAATLHVRLPWGDVCRTAVHLRMSMTRCEFSFVTQCSIVSSLSLVCRSRCLGLRLGGPFGRWPLLLWLGVSSFSLGSLGLGGLFFCAWAHAFRSFSVLGHTLFVQVDPSTWDQGHQT